MPNAAMVGLWVSTLLRLEPLPRRGGGTGGGCPRLILFRYDGVCGIPGLASAPDVSRLSELPSIAAFSGTLCTSNEGRRSLEPVVRRAAGGGGGILNPELTADGLSGAS